MLYLFGPKETDFINGDSDLIHNTYDEVVDRSKGFYLKFKIALDKDERYKNIKKEMIISAHTPDGWNQFRVFDIYNHSNHVEVVATQLHYDLNYKKVYPFVVNKTTAQTALNVFVSKFKSDLPNFKFTSNIKDVHSFSTDDDLERLDEGHNALEILNRIASRWGGELKVDGYNVHLVSKLGKFTNALLYEHKNISEFVDETSMSEIITRIHAVSRFRPEREEGSSEEPKEVTIKVVVDSPLINEYAQVYEEDYTNNDARTRDQLIAWARLKYSTNNVDKPTRSIQVETNIIDGQEINYGDDLVLKYTKHDVDEIIRCVGYQYNPNSRQYISVTLGSNINSLASTITGSVHDSTKNQLSNIEKQVQIIKYAANNVNRVTTGPLPIPDPIEGDMWYYHPEGRPNEVELRIFQDGGWVTIVSDMTGENVRRAIAELETEAEGLAADIVASDQKATAAKEEAGLAKSATEALDLITKETAGKMVDVEQIAADAKTNASNALADASEARTQAGQAFIDAKAAMSDAVTAQTDAQTAMSDAQSALSKADGVESTVNTLSSEVDEVAGKVELKANQTDVDAVKGTVSTHTTTLSQHATAISSKAAQTEVDTVKGTVATHTSTLTQHAKDISARLTQSQVNSLVSDKGYSTVSYVDNQMSATAEGIRTEMTAVEAKIPTQIGGRNLVTGTSEVFKSVEFSGWDYYFARSIPVKGETHYTLSARVIKEAWNQGLLIFEYNDKGAITQNYITNQWYDSRHDDMKNSITIKTKPDTVIVHVGIKNNHDGLNRFQYRELQLEQGDIATDWTPAPEDMMGQNDFNAFKAEYDQSAQGWSSKLTQIENAGYATKTWSNQTFATPQSVTTQLSSYAKSTDLNGLATESYVGSQLDIKAGEISSQVTEVAKRIVSSNLQPWSHGDWTTYTFTGWNGYMWSPENDEVYNIPVTPGEFYTAYVQYRHISVADMTTRIFWYGAGGGQPILESENGTIIPAGGGGGSTITAVAPPDATHARLVYRAMSASGTKKFDARRQKFEKGKFRTEWEKSGLDYATEVKLSSLTQDLSGFKTTVQQTYGTKQQISTVEQKADKLIAKVGSDGGKIGQLLMNDSTFQTVVLDNVAGKNLIPDASYKGAWFETTGYDAVVLSESIAELGLKPGDELTFSVYVHSLSGTSNNIRAFWQQRGADNSFVQDWGNSITSSQRGWLSVTFKIRSTTNAGSPVTRLVLAIRDFDNQSQRKGFYRLAKLEKGKVRTDWVPHMNSLATQSSVTQLSDSITQSITTGSGGKITSINQLTNTVNSMEQVIGKTNDSVARAVMTSSLWETEVSKVIDGELKQEYKTVTSRIDIVAKNDGLNYGTDTPSHRYYDYPLESTIVYGSKINVKFILQGTSNTGQQVAIDHVNSSGALTRVYSTNLTAGESTVSLTFDATQSLLSSGSKIRLKIYGYKSYAAYFEMWYTKSHQVPTDGSNTGAISSKITQLYNMINLSVLGKEGALSRIAIGEEGIQIDGKLLHITAKTFIDNAVIKSAMIDTLDAAKITTGTLNAKNVKVINLDANSISGNEASFISAMFTNRNSALQITGNGITVSKSNGNRTFEVDSSGAHFYSDTGPGAYITTHNVITWNGSSWVDSGANSVMFASELNHSIGIGYKIWSNGKYVTKDAIRLDRSGSGTPELQVNLPIKNVDYQRGMVSGENGTYFRNTQDSAGIWMGDNGKLCLITYGKLYNSTSWLN